MSISNISSLLEDELSNEVRYFGTFERGYATAEYLQDFLAENIGADATVHKGFWYRISSDLIVNDGEHGRQLFKNDYIIFNATKKVSEVLWRDIDIIRDAQSEGEALQTQITYISSIISNDISNCISSISNDVVGLSGELCATSTDLCIAIQDYASKPLVKLSGEVEGISSILTSDIRYLSSELSDYHNTLSGIDRIADDHISTDNLMLTEVVGDSIGTHSHKKYYMTFLSGTIVMKPIA